ncbi:dihydrofolate reductase family protein [Olivibacter sp. SDN3]|uniref:dihydrofolate reductase family protein n=1 Tax=Olivibacter sp. SDN3 TaxID=2764720 RepID=UPI0016510E12|nr:dihydrofolate reductase [Olivibacter sp. SDN3]QNL48106.1 dihydrofolate reductase family protein [Olivibacter sp. SDN3]
MKVTVIANISVNGKVLLSDNPNHDTPQEAMAFYLKFAKQTGNLVIGKKTYQLFQQIPDDNKEVFSGIEIVLLSTEPQTTDKHKVVSKPEEAIKYLYEKGFKEIAVGGGTKTYNSFIEKNLVTDIYFNISPIITGDGGVLANNIDLNTKFRLADHIVNDGFIQLFLTR